MAAKPRSRKKSGSTSRQAADGKKDQLIAELNARVQVLEKELQSTRNNSGPRDSHEHRKAEEALRESEEKFRLLAETSPAAIMIYQCDRLVYVNPVTESIAGYNRDDLMKMSLLEFIHPDDRETTKGLASQRSRGTGPQTRYEVKILTKDGQVRWMDQSSAPITYDHKPAGLVVAFDITERKQAEKALERYRLFSENARDIVLFVAREGRILEANEAATRAYGYSRVALLAMTIYDLRATDTGKRVDDQMDAAFERGILFEAMHRRSDGTIFPVEVSSRGKIIDGQKVLLSIIRDTTERKWAEEELKEAKQQAELYLDLMGHDISNMHQIILGQLELAQDIIDADGRLEGEDREMIDTSVQTLRRSAILIENIRNIQKMRSGEYKFERVDLGEVLGDAVATYSKLPDREMTISFTPVQGCFVRANPLLKDVFHNLLDNAIKHCDDPIDIGVGVAPVSHNGNSFYQVIIEDNGHGVPEDRKAEIFNRLKRGETRARGTGLGLYIVRTLVKGFGGSVRVEDRVPGDQAKGARFVVMLPAIVQA